MDDIASTLQQIGGLLLVLFRQLGALFSPGPGWLVALWAAWWLWCVDWRKCWPRLAEGSWLPLVLLGLMSALVWASLAPSENGVFGTYLPNFWWQLSSVGLLIALALLCGWVQGLLHWYPTEVELFPAVAHDDHGHGHGHGDHGHGHGHGETAEPGHTSPVPPPEHTHDGDHGPSAD